MKTDYVKKGLAIGIIVLFIGAGVYPAIAVKLNTSINTVQDEKSNVNAKKIERLSDLPCNCEKDNITSWKPPFICIFLFILGYYAVKNGYQYLVELVEYLGNKLNCWEP